VRLLFASDRILCAATSIGGPIIFENSYSLLQKERVLHSPENMQFWQIAQLLLNKNHRTLYILELKRSSDRNMDFLRVKENEANEQHNIIIEALKAAASEWMFEQINSKFPPKNGVTPKLPSEVAQCL